ncbi:MAG: hypothetical protein JWL87_513, partial [Candidatus Adlerbacteria bacterium]|nr:hypothetical protein [Candidatus Adlerbacteria bacterium]
FKNWNWSTLSCVKTREARQKQISQTIGEYLTSSLPVLTGYVAIAPPPVAVNNYDGTAGGTVTCQPGSTYSAAAFNCVNSEGDITSPTSIGSSATNGTIAAAAASYEGTGTNVGSSVDYGNKACAYAVNQVLGLSGVPSIDGNSVQLMKDELDGGRGVPVSAGDARAGDIVVWKTNTVSHVGICYDANCSQVISNSSSARAFTQKSGTNFLGVQGEIYRVK